MKVRLSHSSYVIGLFDVLNTAHVNQQLKEGLQRASKRINNEALKDWELDFHCLYHSGTQIRVFKSTKPYVKDKQKYVGITIPIPTIEIVPWGVASNQLLNLNDPPGIERYYTGLEVDFIGSVSLLEYIVNSAKKGITFALSNGINILGQKIKVTDNVFSEADQ